MRAKIMFWGHVCARWPVSTQAHYQVHAYFLWALTIVMAYVVVAYAVMAYIVHAYVLGALKHGWLRLGLAVSRACSK